ncbi:MAG: DUF4190 domain-containing protein [Thermoplasmatota archaeon]
MSPDVPPASPEPARPPYSAPYGAPASSPMAAPPRRTPGMAVAALVVGIVAICLDGFAGLGLLAGSVALVLGIIAKGRASKDPAVGGEGLALAGIILGAVAIVLGVLFWAFFAAVITRIIHRCQANPGACSSSPSPVHSVPSFMAWVAATLG